MTAAGFCGHKLCNEEHLPANLNDRLITTVLCQKVILFCVVLLAEKSSGNYCLYVHSVVYHRRTHDFTMEEVILVHTRVWFGCDIASASI